MAQSQWHCNWYVSFHLVITVASGLNLSYDSSIKHINYDLLDCKTENISAYFDMAGFQIEKRNIHHS
jgi:hypothetical protein